MGFEFKCRLAGEVNGIRGNKLQFIKTDDTGSIIMIEVKVNGADMEDLRQFLGKIVLLEPVKVYQKDYNKYYSIQGISDIKILEKK